MRRVKINVLNNEYFVKTDADEDYITNIAAYLEEKVKEVDPQLGSVSLPYPLLLATLKIADEYFRLKREFEEFQYRAEDRSKTLLDLLEGREPSQAFGTQGETRGDPQPKYGWSDPSKY
ncbi:MAG: cell division protein ZapA [Deltaproteobacteria bacterium]